MIYWLSFRSAEAPSEFNEPLRMNILFSRTRVMHGRVWLSSNLLPGNEIDLNDPHHERMNNRRERAAVQ